MLDQHEIERLSITHSQKEWHTLTPESSECSEAPPIFTRQAASGPPQPALPTPALRTPPDCKSKQCRFLESPKASNYSTREDPFSIVVKSVASNTIFPDFFAPSFAVLSRFLCAVALVHPVLPCTLALLACWIVLREPNWENQGGK